MSYFSGKTVWITGASSGIGEAVAKTLSRENANLILSARRENELERVKNECENSDKIKVLPLDLEQHQNAKDWTEKAWGFFDGIDILLNNGGIGQFGKSLETKDEVERKLFEINYFGNVALAKAVLPKMLEKGSGQITVIGSIAGKFGQANLAAYSASKAAVNLYYESLHQELKDSPVKIQMVNPGFIQTSVTLNSLKPDGTKMQKNSPAQENGMPTEKFAKKLLNFMQKDKYHSYIGGKELLAVPLHSVSPSIFYKLLG